MNKIIEWIKTNWKSIKNILIGLGILLLLISFISNWIQSDRYQTIKKEHDALKLQKKIADHKIDSLKNVFRLAQLEIDKQVLRSDSITKAKNKVIEGMKQKEGQYLNTIADLKNIPPDTIYKKIFTYNPNTNNDLLKYPFGATQIKNIYVEHISLLYNIGLIKDLNTTLGLCNTDSQVKGSIILQKDKQIGSLSGQVEVNKGLITTLTNDNKLLDKAYKSERFWKGAWRITAITTSGLLVYKSLK